MRSLAGPSRQTPSISLAKHSKQPHTFLLPQASHTLRNERVLTIRCGSSPSEMGCRAVIPGCAWRLRHVLARSLGGCGQCIWNWLGKGGPAAGFHVAKKFFGSGTAVYMSALVMESLMSSGLIPVRHVLR